MRKGLIVLLVAVVAVVFALPAMADMTPTNLNVSGFYRSKAWLSNFHDGAGAPSIRTGTAGDFEQTNAYVEQRFRVKFAFGTENVQAVWFLESDMLWGDAAGGDNCHVGDLDRPAVRSGTPAAALGADRIQTETKNIYLWFKVPDTSVAFTVGLQNQSDDYAGIIYGGADMAGIFMTGKFEPVTYKLGWAKLYENDPEDRRHDPVRRRGEVRPDEGSEAGAELLLPPGRHGEECRRSTSDRPLRTLAGLAATNPSAPKRSTCPASTWPSRSVRRPSPGSPSTSSGRSTT